MDKYPMWVKEIPKSAGPLESDGELIWLCLTNVDMKM
jgi:hypothetical protein